MLLDVRHDALLDGSGRWLSSRRPLTLAVAGTPCTPFSAIGNRAMLSHDAIEVWYVWVNEMANSEYDFVFLEESDRFLLELLVAAMQSHYEIKYAIFGSQDLGWPSRRTRFYGVCVNRRSIVWTGQAASDAVVPLLSFFGRACSLEGDFFQLWTLTRSAIRSTRTRHATAACI